MIMDTVLNTRDATASLSLAKAPPASLGLAKLLTLAAGAFAVGTSEFLMMGTLPAVAADLGVSVSAAGQLVSAFAIGIALGGPVLAGMTARLDRRHVLVGALLAFLATNAVVAAAPFYGLAVLMRFLGGAAGGLFYGVAFATAATTAAPGKQGGAIATVLGGVTMTTVLGTPLGAWIGQHLGWRVPYGLIAVISLGIALVVHRLLPRMAGSASVASGMRGAIQGLRALLSVFGNRPLALIYAAIALVNTGWFALYTYIAPYWTEVSGVAAATVPAALLAYGVFSAIGGALGGKLANVGALKTVVASVVAQGLLMLGLLFVEGSPVVSLVLAMLWGMAAWVFVSAVQLRVVELAGSAADVASSVAVSAFNVGNALGALAGGLVVANLGLALGPVAGAVFVVLGLLATAASENAMRGMQEAAALP
jgi:MFS transporter, DHA1 family, inner membrane transport protein